MYRTLRPSHRVTSPHVLPLYARARTSKLNIHPLRLYSSVPPSSTPKTSNMPGISSVTFPANAAKLAEGPTAVQKALDILKSTPGVIGAYHGIQVEDGKTAYFSTIWEGADAHTAFLKGEGHTAYATALKALADGPIDGHYVEVDSDPSKVFDSPVTEGIHFVTKNIDDPVWAQMAASIASVAPASTWGRSGDNHIMYFVGWESVEAHMAAKAKSDGSLVGKAKAAAESVKVAHAKLTKA